MFNVDGKSYLTMMLNGDGFRPTIAAITAFEGTNIHLPTILGFTRVLGFWLTAK